MSEILTDREVLNNIRKLYEEYKGNFDDTDKINVTKSNFPDEYGQITGSLSQQIQNIVWGDDAITVNSNNTIQLKGKIQSLGGTEFIISTDVSDDNPVFITSNNLNLSKTALETMGKLYGYGDNLMKEWTIDKVQSTFNIGNK